MADNIGNEIATEAAEFLRDKDNAYDTDSIIQDLEDSDIETTSNICKAHDNPQLGSFIAEFLKRNNGTICHYLYCYAIFSNLSHTLASFFSTGQIFGYWPQWKEDKQLDGYDRSILNGYTKSQLYVAPVYTDLKEEILESGFCNGREWNIHFRKAEEWMGTKKVKRMRSNDDKYGIEKGTQISKNHLLSVILYTDTNELQNHFSSTFRRRYSFETILLFCVAINQSNPIYIQCAQNSFLNLRQIYDLSIYSIYKHLFLLYHPF